MIACPLCNEQFVPHPCGHGRTKKFCSRTCKTRAANAARTPEQLDANRRGVRDRARAEAAKTGPSKMLVRYASAGATAGRAAVKHLARSLAAQERRAAGSYKDRLKKHINDHKMSMGCAVCGVASPAYILDLHHVDPKTKSFNPSKAKSIALADAEFLKCAVLCAVHHRMVENGDIPCPGVPA